MFSHASIVTYPYFFSYTKANKGIKLITGSRDSFHGMKVRRKLNGEIKWRYFTTQNNDDANPMKGRGPKERDEIRAELYQIICATKSIKSMACVTCIAAAYEMASVTCSDDLYHYTYKPVSERFQYYLQDLSKTVGRTETGIIVADHRGAKPDAAFRKAHERLLRSEAEFTSNYQHLVESLFFLPSDISVGIQLADMVAGAVWRKFEKNDDRCYKMLEPSIRKSPSGQIDGFGIVRFPKGKWV